MSYQYQVYVTLKPALLQSEIVVSFHTLLFNTLRGTTSHIWTLSPRIKSTNVNYSLTESSVLNFQHPLIYMTLSTDIMEY